MENGIKICFVFCYVLKSYSETLFLLHYTWIILDLWVSKEIRETVHFLENNILSYIFCFFSSLFLFYFFSAHLQNYPEDIHDHFMKIGTVLVDPGGLFLALLGWTFKTDVCKQTVKKEYRNSLQISPGTIR